MQWAAFLSSCVLSSVSAMPFCGACRMRAACLQRVYRMHAAYMPRAASARCHAPLQCDDFGPPKQLCDRGWWCESVGRGAHHAASPTPQHSEALPLTSTAAWRAFPVTRVRERSTLHARQNNTEPTMQPVATQPRQACTRHAPAGPVDARADEATEARAARRQTHVRAELSHASPRGCHRAVLSPDVIVGTVLRGACCALRVVRCMLRCLRCMLHGAYRCRPRCDRT